jgi:tetrahydromethanopterin S-methyltransferase subunit G
MKKLLVLSVLLGLLALPMFASDITFGGDVTFGVLSDFGDALNFSKDFTLDIMADIDDYNSLTANIDGLEGQVTGATAAPLNESKILVTTDVGMLFGLPIGLHVNWGYDDPDMNEFQNISGYGNEDPWDFSSPVSGEYWGLEFLVSVSFIEVELAFDPAGSSGGGDLLVGLAAKEPIPGLNAEIYYYQNEKGGSEFAKGQSDSTPLMVESSVDLLWMPVRISGLTSTTQQPMHGLLASVFPEPTASPQLP